MEYFRGIPDPARKVLVLPDDSVIKEVQQFIGVEVSRMKNLSTWKKFISYVTFPDPNFYDEKSGEYTSEGGLKVKVDFKSKKITNLSLKKPVTCKFSQVITSRGSKIIPIRGLFMSLEIKDSFTSEFWSIVPKDVLELLAKRVKPRDVLRLCSVNKKFLNWCTDSFYQNMLRDHFGIESNLEEAQANFIEMARPSVWSCGDNYYGQLGLASVEAGPGHKELIPKRIEFLRDVVAIGSGETFSLFLDGKGSVWTCGLAFGKTIYGAPQRIESLRSIRIEAISTGSRHALFLDSDGQVWSAGRDEDGQLGLGSEIRSDEDSDDDNDESYVVNIPPTLIEDLEGIYVIAVSAGGSHSLFLDSDGQAWSCGYGEDGQLGHGDNMSRSNPTLIESLQNIVAISAGIGHSLFLDSEGHVWSCGANYVGQLGHGGYEDYNTPTRIESLQNIVAISAGAQYSLFLDSDGQVWSCGANHTGQLGLGDYQNRLFPIRIETLQNVTAVSAGRYSMFLDKEGYVWTCGVNDFGQLGLGDEEIHNVPTRIETIRDVVVAISAGVDHSLFST